MLRLLEICCFKVSDAVVAQSAGADRIELCAGRPEGGTTPSFGALVEAHAAVHIPVFPMVRPRGGDFCYDAFEFREMRGDIEKIAGLGFPGLVFGILDSDHNVDSRRCAELVDIARNLNPDIQLTFHRAFDEVTDPISSYQQLAALGFDRVLTSGQGLTALAGQALIERLINEFGNRPVVMPAGGVRPDNADVFLALGATNLHSAATPNESEGVDAATVRSLADAVHQSR